MSLIIRNTFKAFLTILCTIPLKMCGCMVNQCMELEIDTMKRLQPFKIWMLWVFLLIITTIQDSFTLKVIEASSRVQ